MNILPETTSMVVTLHKELCIMVHPRSTNRCRVFLFLCIMGVGIIPNAASWAQTNDVQIQILIPLYIYPDTRWNDVANAAAKVPVTAIINPNSGPGVCPPDTAYQQGLNTLRNNGVTLLGYVPTTNGNRPIQNVKADIDIYNNPECFNVQGIFLDETNVPPDKLSYYEELYNYIKSTPNLDIVVLNPGTKIDEQYISTPAGDIAIIFEDYSNAWPNYQPDAYVSNYPANRFSVLVHTTPDVTTMKAHVDRAVARHIGYIYITDDTVIIGDPLSNPWDTLPGYWAQFVDYLATINARSYLLWTK